MIVRTPTIAGMTLALLVASATPGHAAGFAPFKKKKDDVQGKKLTPAQSALIDKAIVREKQVIKVVKERAPLVETYIQNMKPDPVMRQVPESDEHFLGRVEFARVIGDDPYKQELSGLLERRGRLAAPAVLRAGLRVDAADGLQQLR